MEKHKKTREKKGKKGFNLDLKDKNTQFILVGIFIIAVLAVMGTILMSNMQNAQKEVKPEEVVQTAAKIQFIEVTLSDCKTNKCFSLQSLETAIKNTDKNAEYETKTVLYDTEEGKALVEKYNLAKLPALIISGDISKVKDLETQWLAAQLGTKESDNSLVLRSVPNISYDLGKKKYLGQVTMTTLSFDECKECAEVPKAENFGLLVPPVTIVENKKVNATTDEGKQLIQKYSITAVPTVILSKEIAEYDALMPTMGELGTAESDGSFVFREQGLNPVYFSIKENRLVGYVSAFYIIDSNCTTCPTASDLNTALTAAFGFKVIENKYADVREPTNLNTVLSWGITKVPAVVYVGDMNAYFIVKKLWSNLGIINGDKYILTNMDFLNGMQYEDLNTLPKNTAVNVGELVVNTT
ncbi:MAG: hypothetical protein COT15_03055 [Candidatus Diapherotrites archaeon CG08_land_8_20_14_0_20_34_12]|nr:MAG: hypothetical protein COT15_03055 [Candidatus Diapherotrites archaeon CG08_land_8_20_14_0_20_34_12]